MARVVVPHDRYIFGRLKAVAVNQRMLRVGPAQCARDCDGVLQAVAEAAGHVGDRWPRLHIRFGLCLRCWFAGPRSCRLDLRPHVQILHQGLRSVR